MKIKRFESSCMSEALRQIKKEFGEDAVILSAKTMKKGQGFLNKKSARKVVVTAAIDKKANAVQNGMNAEQGLLRQEDAANDGNSDIKSNASSILKRFNPITKTGQKILKPKIVQQIAAPKTEDHHGAYYQQLVDTGLKADIAAEWDEQMSDLLSDRPGNSQEIRQALAQAIQAKEILGSLHRPTPGQQKCVVMMGPAGVGKTSAVAKMAAKQAMGHPNAIAMISLDNQRVAGSLELERFSKIMGVPFKTAYTPEELLDRLSQLKGYALVIIDTPGISCHDPLQREKLQRLLATLDNAEHLLLLSAALQETATEQIISYFKPLGIHGLFFTGLDWTVDYGTLINPAIAQNLPIGYFSDSPKIPEGIQVASAERLAGLLIGNETTDEQHHPIAFIQKQNPNNAPYYVANRNSDIFHFHKCKAVKRINTENMVVFKDPAEALGQQFKPCRMCSSELIVPKPIDRLVRGYAGNRC